MVKSKKTSHSTGIPQHELEALARCVLPAMQKFFESEEGKSEFEELKKKQTSTDKTDNKKTRQGKRNMLPCLVFLTVNHLF